LRRSARALDELDKARFYLRTAQQEWDGADADSRLGSEQPPPAPGLSRTLDAPHPQV
jgi:hypothetical protein